jgi:glycosyltransferase involved in cell wall biosynthesis
VSDHTRAVARGLADAGDEVEVWTPPLPGQPPPDPGVSVRVLPDHFGPRGLSLLDAWSRDRPRPFRVLVQYVPHAFGCRAMNLPFCLWLGRLARRHEVWTLFHEVASPVGRDLPLRHNVLGGVNRVMAALLARASRRVFVTIPAWADLLRPLGRKGQRFEWLPVPATVPTQVAAADVERVRSNYGWPAGSVAVGHFGTYSPGIAGILQRVLPPLLEGPDRQALLVGRGGREFAARLTAEHPRLVGRVHATGGLAAHEVAAHLSVCDLLVQPYPDGVSCRRSSTMAGLGLGLPVVSNLGTLSEPLWAETGAVALAASSTPGDIVAEAERLIRERSLRRDVGRRGQVVYAGTFHLERTIQKLRWPSG